MLQHARCTEMGKVFWMTQLRVLTIVGARPQFIKAAVLSRALAHNRIRETMVHTGQHFDGAMSAVFFEELGISEAAYRLDINSGGHGEMTGRMLQALEPVVMKEMPNVVVVYGDTNSTVAGALCAAKLQVPVAHVEAGVRSFDRRMPEEINRLVTDQVSDLLFCPTLSAVENLTREGITRGVYHVGDLMYDAALRAGQEAEVRSTILERMTLEPGCYRVATVHRAENTDSTEALEDIMRWLVNEARSGPIVMPLHPRTRLALERIGLNAGEIRFIEPVGYLDMTKLVRGAAAVFTDSGGLQKEAYFHRVPCVTLRSTTEWFETVEAGWNRLWTEPKYRQPRRDIDDYGSGDAGGAIVSVLEKSYSEHCHNRHSGE
jgi:UDP-GlcNAc3NAcA epimerase